MIPIRKLIDITVDAHTHGGNSPSPAQWKALITNIAKDAAEQAARYCCDEPSGGKGTDETIRALFDEGVTK